MKKITHIISILLCFLIFSGNMPFVDSSATAVAVKKSSDNVVVVIDPGHGGVGGTNEGAMYHGYIEKQLTLATAAAMKQTLEQFEGVTVYLTRNTDVAMSLADRAQFAKNVNADFLFSLHYNASPEHNIYGSEVWIPSRGNLYAKGYQFGTIMTAELGVLGLYQRGIKTKVGSKGDYYGIIRNCTLRGIPSVIIEHCHLDHGVDLQFMRGNNPLMQFGYADAIAVAKYFGLRSASLGLDFSDYKKVSVAAPKNAIPHDTTPPEVCTAVKKSYHAGTRTLVLNCTASDAGSPILYYAVSFNGGATYSVLMPWNRFAQNADITVKVPDGASHVIFRAYNQYDEFTDAAPVLVN